MVVPLRLKRSERRRLWTMFTEQRQAFNFGVAATLEVLERDGKAGSRFDAWKTLTEARHDGLVASGVPLKCQRAGVLCTQSPAEGTQTQVERATDSLAAPYPERTIRTIRAAMSASDNPAEQAREIIRAVCWLALT